MILDLLEISDVSDVCKTIVCTAAIVTIGLCMCFAPGCNGENEKLKARIKELESRDR